MVLSSGLCPFLTYANDHGEEGEMEILYIGATLGLIKRHRRNGCKALEMVKWNEKALPRGKWGAHERRRRAEKEEEKTAVIHVFSSFLHRG